MKEKQMSTNAYAPPLRSVPTAPPSTKSRFAALLALRDAARRAFDNALSVPRSAIRWAIGLFHRWVEATGSVGVLSWLGQQARNAAGLFRQVGIVPSALAALSTPPVAAAAARVVRFLGRGILRVASATWTGLKSLLGRCGNTGTTIAEGLGRAGSYIADAFRVVASHPLMDRLAQAVDATLALVRPVSWGLVAHRLLGILVPTVWLRKVFELLVLPFMIDTNLAGNLWNLVSTAPDSSEQATAEENVSTQADLLVSAFGTANGHARSDDQFADDEEPLNRASRRAQQREDAHARRAQHR
jgi:hypothetical protein